MMYSSKGSKTVSGATDRPKVVGDGMNKLGSEVEEGQEGDALFHGEYKTKRCYT